MYSLILHGKRFGELQKWRNLRLLLQNNAFSNSFSSASAANDVSLSVVGRKGKNFTVSYLVDSLGLTRTIAESISKKVSFENKSNPDSVLSLLRSYGFTDSQISTIVTDYPQLLTLDAEKSLGIKLKFLQSRGASSPELTQIVSTLPKILTKKEGKSLSRYYDLIKVIIEADKSSNLEKICHSLPKGSKQENKIRNVLVLRELGLPQRLLFPLLISDVPFVCGKEKFEETLKKVMELGFDPTTLKFLQALRIVSCLREETIDEKVNVYKSLGLTVSDVQAMFKKWPNVVAHSGKKIRQTFEALKKCGLTEDMILSVLKKCPQFISLSDQNILNSSETFLGLGFSRNEFAMMTVCHPPCIEYSAESVKKKTEFIVKKMNWPLKAMTLFPQVLGYSLEKRIVPRCNVIKALMSKGLLGSELPPMASVLACNHQAFLNRYVVKHDEKLVLELMAIFARSS